MLVATFATVRDVYATRPEGVVIYSLFSAMLAFVPAIGPIAGALIAEHFGWRAIFVALGAAAVAAALHALPKWHETRPGDQRRPHEAFGEILAHRAFWTYTTGDWRATIESNLTSAFLGARHQIRAMLERGGGSIIFTSSFVGTTTGFPGMSAYAAAKAGIVGLARVIATEYGARGVRANALLPGGTDTPSNVVDAPGAPPETRAFVEGLHAVKRMAAPMEIARAALYVASDGASFITGPLERERHLHHLAAPAGDLESLRAAAFVWPVAHDGAPACERATSRAHRQRTTPPASSRRALAGRRMDALELSARAASARRTPRWTG